MLDRFAALGIEVLLTKGPVLSARCYGDPGLRQYTDLDLVLRDADIERATETMMALGYDPKIPLQGHSKREKFPANTCFRSAARSFWSNFTPSARSGITRGRCRSKSCFERQARVRFDGHDVPALSVEDELILICIHGAKHFWERLMWIADVAALVSRTRLSIGIARSWQHAKCARSACCAWDCSSRRMCSALGCLERSSTEIGSDAPAVRIAARIARRLPVVDDEPFGLLERAAFRIRMRGGFPPGVAYLLRLSLSPTEEDWVAGAEEKRTGMLDAISRPFRLARKYGAIEGGEGTAEAQ